MISIEIPVTWGTHLTAVLGSIKNQSFGDYEIIIVDSSKNAETVKIANDFDAKVFQGPESLLEARWIGHNNSIGERELFLDETRILAKGALERLNKMTEDMVVIGEGELGNGFWVKLENLDKQISMKYNLEKLNPEFGFILPRLFKRDVLDYSFHMLMENMGPEIFSKVVHIDHQSIFREAYNYSTSVGIIRDPLIFHYGDESLMKIVRKYYRYGKSDRIKRLVPYLNSLNMRKRKRTVPTLKYKILLVPLYSARVISYALGYYIGA
ncbi:MAG: glycosyltransferase family 2 protein [Nitrososphaerota archaeon]|nr:glycosyltransferase family 2 protein [Nitrososphaerota archaeon]